MSSDIEVRKERVPWIPLAALTAVLSFISITTFTMLGIVAGTWQCNYNLGIVSRVTCFAVWPNLLLILMYPLRKRFNISSSLLTSLFAVGNVASFTLGFGYVDWPMWFPSGELYDQLLTNLWYNPPLSAAKAMMTGGVATDWAQWGPDVFVWCLFYITFFFFTSSVVLIFRHAWIDVEQVPFPLALASFEIVKRAESGGAGVKAEGSVKPIYMSPFWIGFVLAFIFEIPVFMARTFPWFPDIYAWSAVCPSGSVHATETDIIASTIVGYTGYSKDAIAFAMALLVPLSVSFNVWFWTIVMWILDQIAYATGSFTGILSSSGNARMCCTTNSLGFTGPFRWNLMSMVGGFLALAAMQIFLRRKFLMTTIMATVGKQKPEWEGSEAMSYRSMYTMLTLSIMACLVSLNLLGVDFMASFILIAFNCFTTWLAMLMLFGLGAFGASDCRIWPVWPMRLRWPSAPLEETIGFVVSNKIAFVGSNVVSYGFGNGFFITALNMKMSSLTGTSNRNAFWVGAMAILISVPVTLVTRTWLVNIYGSRSGGEVGSTQPSGIGCMTYFDSLPSNAIYATYGAAGFVIVTVLSILHARYIWFPLEPVGYIIATNFGGFWSTLWSVFLIAWIVKTIVLRAGGSKLYSEWIIPSVGGFTAGVALGTLLGCIAGVIKFYVPY